MVFLFFLFPPIEAVAILLKFFGFAFFRHDHNILVGGILQILQYILFLIYLFSLACFILHCSPPFIYIIDLLFMAYFTTLLVVQSVLQREEFQGVGGGAGGIGYVPIILWMPLVRSP